MHCNMPGFPVFHHLLEFAQTHVHWVSDAPSERKTYHKATRFAFSPVLLGYEVKWKSLSHVRLFVTSQTAAHRASLSFTLSWSLLKIMSIEWVMPSNHLILCCPLPLLSSVFPRIRVFSNELAFHIRWPKYWSFSFSISPYNEYSGLISFRIDWFDLLAVQRTLKSLL